MNTILEMMNVWNKSLSLSMTTTELLFSSMQTVTYRAAVVGTGSAGPEIQLYEFHEMHIEKFETFTESSKAWICATSHVGEQWVNTIVATINLCELKSISPYLPADWLNLYSECNSNIDNYVSENIKLSTSFLQLAESSLEPVHEKVKGNVERLSVGLLPKLDD